MQAFRTVLTALLLTLLFLPASSGQFNQDDMASDLEEAMTFTKYPTYGQYLEMMALFAESYPDLCRLDTFGTSVEGRLLLAMKISDNPGVDEAEARFLFSSTMHGNELVGYPLMLRMIHHLLAGYGSDAEISGLVDSLEIWINPLANPDGTYRGGNETVSQAWRYNSGGYDLNRNFPDILAGEADDTTGHPLENQHMMLFLRKHLFTLSANLHSGVEVVNYPWDWTQARHADDDWFQLISREYADETHSVDPTYMTYLNNGITNGYDWYFVEGSRQDYVTYFLQGREVTLELSYPFFVDSDSLGSYWNKNLRSFLYYITQATYGIRGRVRSGSSGAPLRAELSIAEHDQSSSVVYSRQDHGDFYRLIKEGAYDVTFTAEGYVPYTMTGIEVSDFQATYLYPVLDSIHVAVEEPVSLHSFRIWPNPAAGSLNVEIEKPAGNSASTGGSFRLSILSSSGMILKSFDYPAHMTRVSIPTSSLSPGIYLLIFRSEGETLTRRFIKE